MVEYSVLPLVDHSSSIISKNEKFIAGREGPESGDSLYEKPEMEGNIYCFLVLIPFLKLR